MQKEYFAHPTSIVDEGAVIGVGTKIWHFSHVFSGAVIGENCSFGQNVMVADGVTIGRNVKVQNNVSIYSGTVIEDDVFLGPSCVLTNVSNPRSQIVRRGVYERTHLRKGCSVGANSTIVCGVTLGQYAFVAAGAVVTKNVDDYTLIKGVPGQPAGWISRHGHPLQEGADGICRCPESGLRYRLVEGILRCIDIAEDATLPEDLSTGTESYRTFRHTNGEP